MRRLRTFVVLAGIVTLWGGVLSPAARAAFPGENGRISFARFSNGGISTVRPNGTGLRRLTHSSTAFDIHSDWSPNGRWIAFDRFRNDSPQVFIMRADGSDVRRVPHLGGFSANPSWAPNGKLLVFEHGPTHGCCTNIYTIHPDGTRLERLTNFTTQTQAVEPEFSPDGRWIAFQQFPNVSPPSAIFLMRADGSHIHRITPLRMDAGHPEWAPDGSVIIFNNDYTLLIGDIFTIHPDGTGLTRLTHVIPQGTADFRPDFSPDGKKIVFNQLPSNLNRSDRVLVMNADGTHVRVLTTNGFAPDWGPRRER